MTKNSSGLSKFNYLIECEQKTYSFNLCLKKVVYGNLKMDDIKYKRYQREGKMIFY